MTRPPTSRRLALAAVAVLTVAGSFFAGRALPGSPDARTTPASPPPPVDRSRQLPAALLAHESLQAPTAAARTFAVLDFVGSCDSSDDFLAVIDAILAASDKTEKTRHLALLFDAWLDRDPTAAFAGVRRVELLRHHAGRVSQTFSNWASNHPLEAADLLRQSLDGRQLDPAAKPMFLDGVDPPEFLLSLVHGLGLCDPDLAATTLARAGASPVRQEAIEVLLQDWYPSHPEAARRWAASISDPQTRQAALVVTATKAGQADDPAPDLEWAMELPATHDRRAALAALTNQWGQRHAADAFAWIAALPDGDLKFALMPDVLHQFAVIDPGAAADWLNRYDAAPSMDASIAAYAKSIQFANPPAAIGSAAAITDPLARDPLILRIARRWLEREPTAATDFIRHAGDLPATVQQLVPGD